MKKTSALFIYFVASVALSFAIPCHAKQTEKTQSLATNNQIPADIFMSRGSWRWQTAYDFIDQNEFTFARGDLEVIAPATTALVLRQHESKVVTTSTLYKLLPFNEKIYVVRDAWAKVIGYLAVYNTSISSMFKPVKTTLYSTEGEVLMNSAFRWSAFRLNPLGQWYKVYSPSKADGEPIISGEHRLLYIRDVDVKFHSPVSVDMRLVLSMLLIQADTTTTPDVIGSLHIEDLKSFSANPPNSQVIYKKEIPVDDAQAKQTWLALRSALSENAPQVPLNDDEFEEIAARLAGVFEKEDGTVDPQDISDAIGSLSDEEKTVLIHLITIKS